MEWSEGNIEAIYQSFAGVKAFVKENKYCSDCDGYIYLAKLPIDLVLSVKKIFCLCIESWKNNRYGGNMNPEKVISDIQNSSFSGLRTLSVFYIALELGKQCRENVYEYLKRISAYRKV